MYQNEDIKGQSLPDKTLCLTFDDGPGDTDGAGAGPRTLEVAQYLHSQHIQATFFVVGKYAAELPEVLPKLEALGHLIGNHTYDHPHLSQYHSNGGDVVAEVARADGVIKKWTGTPITYFRAPYGDVGFAPGTANPHPVTDALNGNLSLSLSHVGPVLWDFDGGDWQTWQEHGNAQTAADNYANAIGTDGKGIVLMHDCTSDMELARRGNRDLEMLHILIPQLKQQGYEFVRLDEVPDIADLSQQEITVALKGANGRYVSPQDGGGGEVLVNGPVVGQWEPLVVEDLGVGKIALRTVTGNYISAEGGGGGKIVASATEPGDFEAFDLISMGPHQVAFRSFKGDFPSPLNNATGDLVATAHHQDMNPDTVFLFEYVT
jgi:peptidoglycan/xylan/chitin deacetylase (PgdA/CDA1 family)